MSSSPWWSWQSIKFCEENDIFRGLRVLEYGSGGSTKWLSQRSKSVVSIEHDPEWASKTGAILIPPDTITDKRYKSKRHDKSFKNYVEYGRGVQFDACVIDGRCRNRCLSVALDAECKYIIFDNSDRDDYIVECQGYAEYTFVDRVSQTSIFVRQY